jgi:hypothetical protein
MIDPVLTARLDALEQSLRRVTEQPSGWKAELSLESEDVEEDLWKGLDWTIGKRVRVQLGRVKEIRRKLVKAERNGNRSAAEQYMKEAWQDYAKAHEQSQEVFREWLDVIGGITLRAKRLDGSLCHMADELIRRFATASGGIRPCLTIPAPEETLAKTLGRVIRLRFPEWSMWTLPVIAHEYARVVVDEVDELHEYIEDKATEWVEQDGRIQQLAEEVQRLAESIENQDGTGEQEQERHQETVERYQKELDGRKERYKTHLLEFLADSFATYTIGPAYASAVILLRFDPSVAYHEDGKHTAYAKRACVILAMLGRMDRMAGFPSPYREVAEHVSNEWQGMLARAKPSGTLEAEVRQQLEDLVEGIWDMLYSAFGREPLYPHAGETGWQIAQQWSADWREQLEQRTALSTWEVSPTSKLHDVLNAAWLCRLAPEVDADRAREIAEAAHGQCQAIIARRRPSFQPQPQAQPTG